MSGKVVSKTAKAIARAAAEAKLAAKPVVPPKKQEPGVAVVPPKIVQPDKNASNVVNAMSASTLHFAQARNAPTKVPKIDVEKVISNPDALENVLNKFSTPSLTAAELAERDAAAAAKLKEAEGTATYDNLKRRRSSKFMGTDPEATKALLQELLVKKQLQEAVISNPDIIAKAKEVKEETETPKNISHPNFAYLEQLAANARELQTKGAVPLNAETAIKYGIKSYGGNVFPGAHIVPKDSQLAEFIREQSRLDFEARQREAAKNHVQFPKKMTIIAGSIIISSYALTLLWDVQVEMNGGEPPVWYQYLRDLRK